MKQEFNVDERSIVTKREFPYSIEKVWRMWTELPLLEQWWGPNGFRTFTSKFDFSVGGRWVFVMEGSDGTKYSNEIQFERIEELSLIHYIHLSNHKFKVHVAFDKLSEESTAVTFRMLFASAEQRDSVKIYAEPGNKQFMDKLAALLETLPDMEVF